MKWCVGKWLQGPCAASVKKLVDDNDNDTTSCRVGTPQQPRSCE